MGTDKVGIRGRPDGLILGVQENQRAMTPRERSDHLLLVVLVVGLAARLALASLVPPQSDVYYYLTDAVGGLLNGMNPYSMTYTGIPANLASSGVGHIFTYLPFTVAYLAPFGALGDVRTGVVAADLLVATLLFSYGGRYRLASATVYLLLPATVLFSTVYLNAALVAMLFIAGWLVLEKSGRGVPGAACLGLALASSQFSFLILPFALFYYLRVGRWKEPLVAGLLAALVVAPFFAAGPAAFVSETITFQFERDTAALIAAGGPTGFVLNPSLNAMLISGFGVSAPVYLKVLIEAILALPLLRVRGLRSLVRNSFLFTLASVFILPNDFFWAYLELPFMLLLFWVSSPADGGPPRTTIPKI